MTVQLNIQQSLITKVQNFDYSAMKQQTNKIKY